MSGSFSCLITLCHLPDVILAPEVISLYHEGNFPCRPFELGAAVLHFLKYPPLGAHVLYPCALAFLSCLFCSRALSPSALSSLPLLCNYHARAAAALLVAVPFLYHAFLYEAADILFCHRFRNPASLFGVDPYFGMPDLENFCRSRLCLFVIHNLHHFLRFLRVKYPHSLLNCLVNELYFLPASEACRNPHRVALGHGFEF